MLSEHLDIVVLGGGPAGAAFALTVLGHRPDTRVAIVERGSYARAKVGESLPPIAGSLLRQLGVWEDFVAAGHRPAHGVASAWGGPRALANEFFYGVHGCGWHLDRRGFDRGLVDAAVERGASLSTGARVTDARSRRPAAAGWELEVEIDGARRRLTADLVIDASGRKAAFARGYGGGEIERDDRLLAIIGRFRLDAALPDSYTLVEARADGWSYCAELPDRALLVAAMTDADLSRRAELRDPDRWLAWLREGPLTAARLACGRFEGELELVAAGSQRLRSAAGEDWLAVGDAASCYDPLSSQGIIKALRSGIFAGYAALDRLAGRPEGARRYAELLAREYGFYRAKQRELYAQERRWAAREFWRRRAGA